MFTCFDIANHFIWLAHETGSFVSNLKLQKLVYYAQAWHLAIHDAPLFPEDFQAWVHGPVIPELFQKYQHFSWLAIDEAVAQPSFSLATQAFLQDITEEYFACDAYELERMTQWEAPWQQARAGLPADEPCEAIIQKTWMKEYYAARAVEEETQENAA